ncbi:hypothetical protein ACOME3_010485 [Neoechinorhynchus agilis]
MIRYDPRNNAHRIYELEEETADQELENLSADHISEIRFDHVISSNRQHKFNFRLPSSPTNMVHSLEPFNNKKTVINSAETLRSTSIDDIIKKGLSDIQTRIIPEIRLNFDRNCDEYTRATINSFRKAKRRHMTKSNAVSF